MSPLHLVWFRQDLRLDDNPALYKAAQMGTVLPIYILDDHNADKHRMGAASRVWLHHSLEALNTTLHQHLHLYEGDAYDIFTQLISRYNIASVHWNRCYEPWRITRDKRIKSMLQEHDIDVHSHKGSLLWEPWEVLKDDGTHFKVFTPFYKRAVTQGFYPDQPLEAPASLSLHPHESDTTLDSLQLLPSLPWGASTITHWQSGESAAQQQLEQFIEHGIHNYKEGRNFPAKPYVSNLSPYLHFGEISPRRIWHRVKQETMNKNHEHFLSELGWREFSYYLLYHFPDLPEKNFQPKFNDFSWDKNDQALDAWQKGLTGYPIIDAGMRQLWQTGTMHNRVRMLVGSFLVKNLLLDWRLGEAWFWDCLFDADLANNSASWQWIAGSGADAAPYFRIFNPVTQAHKFDPEGDYVRSYVPEIAALPTKYLHTPWEAPSAVLNDANITLGETYPTPIVDLKSTRDQALSKFHALKNKTS